MAAKQQTQADLQRALLKREQGRGLKNSEISMLRRHDRGEDPFAKVATWPASTGKVPGENNAGHVGKLSAQITEGIHEIGNRVALRDDQSNYTEGAAIDAVGSNGKLNKVPKHSTWATPTDYPTVSKVVNGSTSVLIDSTGVTITTSGGKTCTLAFSAITADMTVREIDVCDSGTPKKMLILASAPYTP